MRPLPGLTHRCPAGMLSCMRTTVNINDSVLIQAKRVAAESHRTLTSVIEDALRADFARRSQPARSGKREHVLTFRGTGVHPGVSLDSMAELLDIMDGVE